MLVVIGLDGATFDLLCPWIDKGYLPILAHLMKEGTCGQLESTLPPITAPAWVSFMTGKNPGRHSVFDFFIRDAAATCSDATSFNMINASHINSRLLWEYLSDTGLSAGVLNVPVTYPPRPLNGYLVPGLLSPDQGQTTFPPDLLKPYQAELGLYRLTPRLLYQPGNEDLFVADLLDVNETQIRYLLRLVQDHPTDFLMVHFLTTDIAQHKLWKHQDVTHPWHRPELATRYGTLIRDIYVQLDVAIGQLLERLPSDSTVIVMSDHGFGPLHRTVNLNNYFIQTGLMTLQRDPGKRARAWLFQHHGPSRIASKIFKLLGKDKLLGFEDVDWRHTLAYSLGHVGQVYLNLRGREPYGIVESNDYATVRTQVIETLYALCDPLTGQKLVEQVIPREQAVSGPFLANGPDLHLVMDGYRAMAYPMFAADGKVVTWQVYGDSGSHRLNGIFIAYGPEFRQGQTVTGARIIDLAPTILHLMGMPAPDDMDGRVLEEALTTRHPLRQLATWRASETSEYAPSELSDNEQSEIKKRLRALGYLE